MPRDFDDYNGRNNNGRDYDGRDYDDRDDDGYSNPNPFGFPGMPGFFSPGRPSRGPQQTQGPGRGQMPPGPPPNRAPRRGIDRPRRGMGQPGQPGVYFVDPGAIRGCLYKFTYIWLENGRSYWAWLTFIGRNSVAGYRWTGYRWVYFGTDLDNISDFECY